MADASDDRTELPTPRRLEKAWEDGDVAVSREAVGVVVLAAGGLTLFALADRLVDEAVRMVADLPRALGAKAIEETLPRAGSLVALVGAVLAAAAAAGTVATLVQTRAGFWPEKAAPDPSRLFSGGRLSHLFSREVLADVGVALVRAAALAFVAWQVVGEDVARLVALLREPPSGLLGAAFAPAGRVARALVLGGCLFAAIDVLLVRHRFTKRLRMSKEEVRREMKEEDGDPLLRSRRRRRHRELAKGRAEVEVPRADALLVNPTHVAVALRYRKDEGRAPRVVAKGKGVLAERMRDLARSHGVPIVQDVPLARLLYRRVKVGREIPAETWRAVAAVLAYVYRITRRPGPPAR